MAPTSTNISSLTSKVSPDITTPYGEHAGNDLFNANHQLIQMPHVYDSPTHRPTENRIGTPVLQLAHTLTNNVQLA